MLRHRGPEVLVDLDVAALSTSTPTSSRPSPSVLPVRPAATRSCSASISAPDAVRATRPPSVRDTSIELSLEVEPHAECRIAAARRSPDLGVEERQQRRARLDQRAPRRRARRTCTRTRSRSRRRPITASVAGCVRSRRIVSAVVHSLVVDTGCRAVGTATSRWRSGRTRPRACARRPAPRTSICVRASEARLALDQLDLVPLEVRVDAFRLELLDGVLALSRRVTVRSGSTRRSPRRVALAVAREEERRPRAASSTAVCRCAPPRRRVRAGAR